MGIGNRKGKFYVSNATQHKICNKAGCRKIVKTHTGFCAEHKPKSKPRAPEDRDRFLDSQAWRDMSEHNLRMNPWCKMCMDRGDWVPAQHSDHILPRSQRPDLALEASNVQSLCISCHSAKTRKELRGSV